MSDDVGDWTAGHAAILYEQCADCRRIWYFARPFCPHCGSGRVGTHESSGRGTVYAATLVERAPSKALQAFAPYRILLVEAEEGFRLMAHGALDLRVGDTVTVSFRPFGDGLVPFFERVNP
jgi:uncharacterized OB-fold protein